MAKPADSGWKLKQHLAGSTNHFGVFFMRCVILIDKSVALALGGKCKCCGCNCRKCGSKCKCKMRVACVTRPMRPTRQKRLQNAENLLLKIRVESSNKLIQSACVAPSDVSPILCPLASVCPLFAQCQPVYLRVRCTVPRRKACNTNQRIMASMAVFALSEREGESRQLNGTRTRKQV